MTVEAIRQIMQSTIDSLTAFERGQPLRNQVPVA
jgi:hypothetical protein